jgi:hypothetical protein
MPKFVKAKRSVILLLKYRTCTVACVYRVRMWLHDCYCLRLCSALSIISRAVHVLLCMWVRECGCTIREKCLRTPACMAPVSSRAPRRRRAPSLDPNRAKHQAAQRAMHDAGSMQPRKQIELARTPRSSSQAAKRVAHRVACPADHQAER